MQAHTQGQTLCQLTAMWEIDVKHCNAVKFFLVIRKRSSLCTSLSHIPMSTDTLSCNRVNHQSLPTGHISSCLDAEHVLMPSPPCQTGSFVFNAQTARLCTINGSGTSKSEIDFAKLYLLPLRHESLRSVQVKAWS